MMKAETKAGAAAVVMLLAISSYNVLPSLKRGAYELAVVQIAFTAILAIIPFVSRWDAETRKRLTIAFMLVNGLFAFQNTEHWHDDERTAHNQHEIWVTERDNKKAELNKLGDFTATDASQVEFAQNAANSADADKASARASADAAKAAFAVCEKKCAKLDQEAHRLETVAERKETEAKTAHDELQKLSGWRTLTNQAAPIKARIDELNKALGEKPDSGEVDSDSWLAWLVQKVKALFIAGLIEAGNRYGPEGVFFIMGLSASSAKVVQSEPVQEETRTSEAPSPDTPPRKTRTAPRTQKLGPVQGGATVINMDRSKVVQMDRAKLVQDPRFKGMTQREIADQLGWSKTMVQRAQAFSASQKDQLEPQRMAS